MPYTEVICGIYAIINRGSQKAYIGQSRNLRKRLSEHQRLLVRGAHPNPYLQNAWNKHGSYSFAFEIIATCASPEDLNSAEAPFLTKDATYDGCGVYNIARVPTSVMTGRKHSDATKAMMSANRKGRIGHVTPEYRAKLSAAQTARYMTPERIERISRLVVLVSEGMSITAAGSIVGFDPSTAARIYKKYKEHMPWVPPT